MTEPLTVLRGTLDVLALRGLALRPMHGFELTGWLEERSKRRLALEDAAIYQAVYRLEKRGLVEGEWGLTEENRRARFYRLTAAGRRELAEQTSWWLRYSETVTALLTDAPETA